MSNPCLNDCHDANPMQQEDVIPLGEFIGQMEGCEDVPGRFNELAELTRKKETVSFRVIITGDKRKAKPEYLSFHEASTMSKMLLGISCDIN